MENASKALLMAGGILISLIIIGALLLMFNQLGAFQKSQTSSEKDSQLATFNQDFARYADETSLKGVDIISLANKVVDYNKKSGITNSVNYDQKITLKIKMNNFVSKHGKNIDNRKDCLFSGVLYTIEGDNSNTNQFYKVINYYSDLEARYGLKILQLLSSNYDTIEKENTKADKEKKIKEIAGKPIIDKDGNSITEENVSDYREYSEFKTSTFKTLGTPKYKEGQISELSFEFVE